MGKFDAKSYEGIFVGYSTTSKAYKVFIKFSLSIEESIHVKFEESNPFVKNVVDPTFEFVDDGVRKLSIEDNGSQEKKDEVEDEQAVTQDEAPKLPKDWRFAVDHPKDHIIGEISKGITT